MNKEISELLKNLEPEIDKKCIEIKETKKIKHKQILYILLLILVVTTPSLLIIFNINVTYFIIGILVLILLVIFIKLPDLLKSDVKEVCYE
ncbi:hypothetical protein [Thomasclavelia spiroformis]|uniref:hypothetical protein n=1 Tax=Thomasclavelia spiroformis TaxID=29348 RepID=UPI0026DB5940|nr:hypothetical protein [Thomasclavelia spiroformis]